MVHRQLGLAAGLLALVTPAARAANHKVAVGNYQWSTPVVNVDLGEHVTWFWVGPDTMHSITGTSLNDAGWDSDPTTSQPLHHVGDTFSFTFNAPGTYTFQCKLHSNVHGTIVVSAAPGDPTAEPDPDPPLNVDLTPPYLTGLHLRGERLRFALDSASTVDAEIYRLTKHGRRYAGYQVWSGHVGYNAVHFAHSGPALRKGSRLRPGRYEADINATDTSANISAGQQVQFAISSGR